MASVTGVTNLTVSNLYSAIMANQSSDSSSTTSTSSTSADSSDESSAYTLDINPNTIKLAMENTYVSSLLDDSTDTDDLTSIVAKQTEYSRLSYNSLKYLTENLSSDSTSTSSETSDSTTSSVVDLLA